jgi:hypothetical protein
MLTRRLSSPYRNRCRDIYQHALCGSYTDLQRLDVGFGKNGCLDLAGNFGVIDGHTGFRCLSTQFVSDCIGCRAYFIFSPTLLAVWSIFLPAVSAGPGLSHAARPTTIYSETPISFIFSATFILIPNNGSLILPKDDDNYLT